ncbi:uncharacterized protein HD556DRAFT_1451548 [Suillus plorans]|uniref:Uncharacterized protein n=1 Tax=Suillus plorans TaxID=116603 RepID=A0A9P7AAL0_9AGAM|nr:uncharacterized protein HD556DRAFT_1451548 [Suillus plorans]KAG1784662.1 hypothetical protein HD556DRAFT_1451548 [Suillus plorans]
MDRPISRLGPGILQALNFNLLDKSLLIVDATRRPVRQPIKLSNRVPQGFLNGTPHRAHSSGRLDMLAQSRIVYWAQNPFSSRPGSAARKCRSAVVHIPFAKGNRNASAREKRSLIPKMAVASSSRPSNSNVTQQSSGKAQVQSSSQPQGAQAISMSSLTPTVVATFEARASSTDPHVTIKHAGRWIRF